jgi:hypothetical protein
MFDHNLRTSTVTAIGRAAAITVTCAAAVVLCLARPASAATLVTNASGQLTGATGVIVNATSYNVEFVDGTCSALFSDCDSSSDFAFQNSVDAYHAAVALLGQVFLNTGAGQFASDPSLTFGCSEATALFDSCTVIIPYALGSSDDFLASYAKNVLESFVQVDAVGFRTYSLSKDTSDSIENHGTVFASFTLPSATPPIPEPSSWAMMLIGFGVLGASLRRRRPGRFQDA